MTTCPKQKVLTINDNNICYDNIVNSTCNNPDISGYCLLTARNLCKKKFTYNKQSYICEQNSYCNVGIKTLDTSNNNYFCKSNVCENGNLSEDESYCISDPKCSKNNSLSDDKTHCKLNLQCPSGTVLSEDKQFCKLKLKCPKGYTLSDDRTFCKVDLKCPVGIKSEDGTYCLLKPTCPKNYDLSNNICLQKVCDNISEDKTFCRNSVICSSIATISDNNNVCISCPDNYYNINNKCVTRACKRGLFHKGKCYINNTIKTI
jgi:hypothetical protein